MVIKRMPSALVGLALTVAMMSFGALAPANAAEVLPPVEPGAVSGPSEDPGAPLVDGEARTVLSTDAGASGLGIGLPGVTTETSPVALDGAAAELFNGLGAPLLTTKLEAASVTAYETEDGSQSIVSVEGSTAP